MNVLSLCDGMSCGQIALEQLSIPVEKYFASEIKPIAIKVTQDNYPNTIQIGDVKEVSYKDGKLTTAVGAFDTTIDLVMFGAPCQSFSIAMRTPGRIGLKDENRSGLFYECYRVLREVMPKFFLFENVASMRKEDKETLSGLFRQDFKIEPIQIDGSKFGPALRKRLYWTNLFPNKLIEKESNLQDILESGYTDRKKARCLLVSDSRPLTTPCKMFHRYYGTGFTTLIFKNEQHYLDCCKEYKRLGITKAKDLDDYTGHIFDGVRCLNQHELEACQCIPKDYTKCLTRNEAADVLGDGWNVEAIKYIFAKLELAK